MRITLAAAGTLLLATFNAAPARAVLIEMRCEYSVPTHASALEDSKLGGKIVRGALKSDCVTADPGSAEDTPETIRYYSPVHLLPSGLCKAVEYDEKRQRTGTVLKKISDRGCPAQHFETYVETADVSDAMFFKLMKFWRNLPAAHIDADMMVRRTGRPASAESEKGMRTFLDGVLRNMAIENGPIAMAAGDNAAKQLLLPNERGAQTYTIEDTYEVQLTIMISKGGFEIIGADELGP